MNKFVFRNETIERVRKHALAFPIQKGKSFGPDTSIIELDDDVVEALKRYAQPGDETLSIHVQTELQVIRLLDQIEAGGSARKQ